MFTVMWDFVDIGLLNNMFGLWRCNSNIGGVPSGLRSPKRRCVCTIHSCLWKRISGTEYSQVGRVITLFSKYILVRQVINFMELR